MNNAMRSQILAKVALVEREIEVLGRENQELRAERDELLRVVEQAAMRCEELEAQIDSIVESAEDDVQ